MCHMLADSDEELLEMADRIGVDRRWHQHPGMSGSHFDIAQSKRAQAVELGAVEITRRQAAAMRTRRRHTGALGPPDDAEAWAREKLREELRNVEEGSC